MQAHDYGGSRVSGTTRTPTHPRRRRNSNPQPWYKPRTSGSTVQVEVPQLETLANILKEQRLATTAAIEQQREITLYLRGLSNWLERDVHERRAELQNINAGLDQLEDEIAQRIDEEHTSEELTPTEDSGQWQHVGIPQERTLPEHPRRAPNTYPVAYPTNQPLDRDPGFPPFFRPGEAPPPPPHYPQTYPHFTAWPNHPHATFPVQMPTAGYPVIPRPVSPDFDSYER